MIGGKGYRRVTAIKLRATIPDCPYISNLFVGVIRCGCRQKNP